MPSFHLLMKSPGLNEGLSIKHCFNAKYNNIFPKREYNEFMSLIVSSTMSYFTWGPLCKSKKGQVNWRRTSKWMKLKSVSRSNAGAQIWSIMMSMTSLLYRRFLTKRQVQLSPRPIWWKGLNYYQSYFTFTQMRFFQDRPSTVDWVDIWVYIWTRPALDCPSL